MLITADTVITGIQNAAARVELTQLLDANRAWEARTRRTSVLTPHLEAVLARWDDDADGQAALQVWREAEAAAAETIGTSVPGQLGMACFHRTVAGTVEKALEQTRR